MKTTTLLGILGLLAVTGSANALTFNEGQGETFSHTLIVTPEEANGLMFSVSGLNNQFSSLSFSFVGVNSTSGPLTPLTVAATHSGSGPWEASFDDWGNNSFYLSTTPYTVIVSGVTSPLITGGQATVTVSALYGTVTAVPEPESYAMLLAGLGLMGTIARRRSKKVS